MKVSQVVLEPSAGVAAPCSPAERGSYASAASEAAASSASEGLVREQPAAAAEAEPSAEPTVAALVARHAAGIATMRSQLSGDALYDAGRHDDLWCLRFLLSHSGRVKKATAAARATIAFRAEKRLDEMRAFVLSRPREEWPGFAAAAASCSLALYQPDPDRGPFVCFRHKHTNMHAVAAPEMSAELQRHLAHLNEWVWAVCDEVTRRTGRIARVSRLDDFEGFTLKSLNWTVLWRFVAHSSGGKEPDLRPQLIGALYAFNLPSVAETILRTIHPFLPPRAAAKIRFIDCERRPADRRLLATHIAEVHLPDWLGGASGVSWPPRDAVKARLELAAK